MMCRAGLGPQIGAAFAPCGGAMCGGGLAAAAAGQLFLRASVSDQIAVGGRPLALFADLPTKLPAP
jgi:hypothetical protein